jgi:hypothetical protein
MTRRDESPAKSLARIAKAMERIAYATEGINDQLRLVSGTYSNFQGGPKYGFVRTSDIGD